MKKVSLTTIREFLSKTDFEDLHPEVMEELNAELNRYAEDKLAKETLYAKAKVVVLGAMDAPATIGEIYDAVAKDLPEDFTKGMLQYAITRLWKDEITKTEGKVNTYVRKD